VGAKFEERTGDSLSFIRKISFPFLIQTKYFSCFNDVLGFEPMCDV
jgi:hypothetical protein